MKMNRKGAISFEQIVLFILAIVVLVLVVMYFTGTFARLQVPVNETISGVEAGIECSKACSDGDSTKYANLNCQQVLGKSFADCRS